MTTSTPPTEDEITVTREVIGKIADAFADSKTYRSAVQLTELLPGLVERMNTNNSKGA